MASSEDFVDTSNMVHREGAFRARYAVIGDDVVQGCAQKTFGSCLLTQCEGSGSAETEHVDAGEISLGGGFSAPMLFADAFGEYEDYFSTTEALFAPGASLVASVSGSAEVAAHSLTVTAPTPPRLNLAVVNSALMLDSSESLLVSWSGGAGETLALSLTTADSSALAALTCSFPFADGQGEVPQGAIQFLLPGALISLFSVDVQTSQTLRVGDVEARFRVRMPALLESTGAPLSGELVVE